MGSEYRLEVSRDCGITYEVLEEANNLSDLKDKCEQFDKNGWRWVIKDINGDILAVCQIHEAIFRSCKELISPNVQSKNNHQGVNYHESGVKGDQPLPGADFVHNAKNKGDLE